MLGLVLLIGLAGLGYWRGWARSRLWGALAVLWVVIVAAHLLAGLGMPALGRVFGGSLLAWVALGVIGGLVWAYAALLARLRGRAAEPVQASARPAGTFSEAELDRYARHIMLRELGGPGQKKLKSAKVLVVGAGGLGSPVLLYLAAAGVGTIGVVDDDVVSNSNLQRQVIHRDADIGIPKVFSAEAAMRALNPHIEVRPYNRRLNAGDAAALVGEYDLVIDGTDNFETRYLLNAACVAAGKPLLSGAITQWEGQLSLYDPAKGAPCYACVFPEAPAPGLAPSCAAAGVIGALPGVIGTMMAGEAVKDITGAGRGLRGRLLIHDMLWGESREIAVKRRADCAVCGARAEGAGASGGDI